MQLLKKLFRKRRKPLKCKLLRQWRTEAIDNLRFYGKWSGYWSTSIAGVTFESDRISGFKFVVNDCDWFIHGALLARVLLERQPAMKAKAIERQAFGLPCTINEQGELSNRCCLE